MNPRYCRGVWPGESQALVVWADELQAQGEPLGQLVAASLRAEELYRQARMKPELRAQAEAFAREVEALRVRLAPTLLGPALDELPRVRLCWQHGLVRGLFIDHHPSAPEPRTQQVCEGLAELLTRPVLSKLDQIGLDLDLVQHESGHLHELFTSIYSERALARPRRLVLGRLPRSFLRVRKQPRMSMRRSRLSLHSDTLADGQSLGLSWLMLWGEVQALPWSRGDAGTRLQNLRRCLAGPCSPAIARRLACALWDTSLRVRRELFEALPELPDSAAPLLRGALALAPNGRRIYGDALERCLTRVAAQRPTWVTAIGEEMTRDEPWIARWLAGVGRRTRPEAEAAIPQIEACLASLDQPHVGPGYRGHGFRVALAGFDKSAREQAWARPTFVEESAGST